MNKYKEALNYIKEIVLDEHADGYYQPRTVEHYYYEVIDDLNELVEKATLKKPILTHDYDGYVYECPNCHMEFRPDYIMRTVKWKGCPYCLQALDWSEDD